MDTVLMTAVGSASAWAAYRGFKALGLRVVGCDIYPREWNVNSGDMDAFFQAPLATHREEYIGALLDMAKTHGYTAILPLTDVEIDALSPCHERFRQQGIQLLCLDERTAAACRDKLSMADFLRQNGLCQTIDTYPAEQIPKGAMTFPMMLKQLRGRSSQGQVVVHSREELAFALETRKDYIAQPFIGGHIFTVDVARDRHGHVAALPREELLRTGNGLGTTVHVQPQHPLAKTAANIAEAVGIVGVVNMEFIAHDEKYYFLEINPRYSGGIGFSCLAGYDFIKATLDCYEGKKIAPIGAIEDMILSQRYEQFITKK